MKRPALAAAALAFVTMAALGGTAEPSPLGEWWTPGFGARIEVEPCGDALCGRIVWLWDETPADIADRGPLIGRKVVDGMRRESVRRWSGGRLYNPEDGREYEGSLDWQAADRLVVSGCVLFVCRTQVWRRVDAQRCPPVAAR